jgi:hypothetical protein
MAKYTIELRHLIEKSDIDVNSYMQNYPLYVFKKLFQNVNDFGKNYKGEQILNFRDYLNDKIYTHFYFREIGLETGHRFAFCLERKMKEIMPFYNQRFESIDIEFNPLWNVDLTETFTHNVEDTGTGSANGTTTENGSNSESRNENGTNTTNETLEQNVENSKTDNSTRTPNLTSDSVKAKMDTAQQPITTQDLKSLNYFSEGEYNVDTQIGTETNNSTGNETGKTTNDNESIITTDNEITSSSENTGTSTTETTSSNTSSRTETYTRKQEGSSAGYLFTQNIQEWRKIMINIPMEICEELDELFMQID